MRRRKPVDRRGHTEVPLQGLVTCKTCPEVRLKSAVWMSPCANPVPVHPQNPREKGSHDGNAISPTT